jgi:hypothetical protein
MKIVIPFCGKSISKTAKVRLHALIDPFGLPVGLRVVSGAHPEFDTSQPKELTPKVACENLVTIRHKGSREAMEAIYMQHKQLGNG